MDPTHESTSNAYVERANGGIEKLARCLMLDSRLKGRFWTDAVRHAAWIHNRLSSKARGWKSPLELWTEAPPNYQPIYLFGCVCWIIPHADVLRSMSQNLVLVSKQLWPRAIQDVYLSENEDSAEICGHKVFVLQSQRKVVAKNVRFSESHTMPVDTPGDTFRWTPLPDPAYSPFTAPMDLAPAARAQCVSLPGTVIAAIRPHLSAMLHDDIETGEPVELPASSLAAAVNEDLNGCSTPEGHIPLGDIDAGGGGGDGAKANRCIEPSSWLQPFKLFDEAVLLAVQTSRDTNGKLLEPLTLGEVKGRPDWPEWRKAMESELQAMRDNKVWKVEVPLPDGTQPIRSKWVFKAKLNGDNTIAKYTTRLVAIGTTQRPGRDFDETFSPVTRIQSIRLLIALACRYRFTAH